MKRNNCFIVVGLILPALVLAQNYEFGPNVRVNDDSPGSHGHLLNSPGRHNIAARGDTVYVADASDRADDGYFHAYFARSTDGGESFLPSIRVDSDRDVFRGPSLALDERGDIHLCWLGRTLNGTGCVSYARSSDGGRSFTVPIQASETTPGIWSASIAVSQGGQRVYITRDQGLFPDYDIFLSRSTDGGRTFALPEIRVNSDTVRTAKDPAIAVCNDTIVLVAWDDYDLTGLGVYFSRSLDGGNSFGPGRLLSDTTAGDTGRARPSIGIDSMGGVYVIYRHPGAALSISISDDTGRSFRPEQAIPGTAGGDPSLWASADGRLYLTYDFSAAGNEYVRFVFSPDRGTTFFAPVDPSDGPYAAMASFTTVAANDQGRVFVAWEDTRNDPTYWNDDIYLATGAMAAIAEPEPHRSTAVVCSVRPNPTRAPVHIEYSSLQPEAVGVAVYDLSGRLVRQLENFYVNSGHQFLTWDGRDTNGSAVEPGIYFVRVQTSTGSLTRRVQYLGS